jgi:hypothetical protein
MPKFLEVALEKAAAKKGKTGRAAARYVYGAMNNMGAMHGNKETAKGARMAKKHEKDAKKAETSSYTGESHAYNFRSRNNLKRGKPGAAY